MATKLMVREIYAFPNGCSFSSLRPEAQNHFAADYVRVEKMLSSPPSVQFTMEDTVTDAALDAFIAGTSGRFYDSAASYFAALGSSSKGWAGNVWVIDGRTPSEGAGNGTGVLAYCRGGTWYRASDDGLVEV